MYPPETLGTGIHSGHHWYRRISGFKQFVYLQMHLRNHTTVDNILYRNFIVNFRFSASILLAKFAVRNFLTSWMKSLSFLRNPSNAKPIIIVRNIWKFCYRRTQPLSTYTNVTGKSLKLLQRGPKTRTHQNLLTAREDQDSDVKMRSLYLSNASPIPISVNTS